MKHPFEQLEEQVEKTPKRDHVKPWMVVLSVFLCAAIVAAPLAMAQPVQGGNSGLNPVLGGSGSSFAGCTFTSTGVMTCSGNSSIVSTGTQSNSPAFSSAGFYNCTAQSGHYCFLSTVNGSRIDFGAGASDYASSDGTTVTFAGPLTTAGTPLTISDSNALLYLGSVDGVNTGRITTNIAAATAGATAASAMVKVYPQNTLDAADWVFSLGTGANAASLFNVAYNGVTQNTMGTVGNLVPIGGLANATTADVTSSGASNLISYTLPANALVATNRCLRIKGWGTALNNANAKTVALDFGSQTIISKILTPSIANTTWSFQATVCRSGSNTQDIYAEAWNPMGTTVSSVDANTVLYQAARTAGTQTETATITIKGKTTTATTTDVTMDGLTVEFM